MSAILLLVVLALAVYKLFSRHTVAFKKASRYGDSKTAILKTPPGPMGLPVIGNMHLLGKNESPFQTFTQLSKEWGDIFSLTLGSQKCVVVNNLELIREVLNQNGKFFGGRPDFMRFHKLFAGDRNNYIMPEVHHTFANAGQKAGLEIWRIEDFEPVPVPTSQFGNFYAGDSYIVLKTTGDVNRKTWDIHFWLGSTTSQDEAGTAAILAVNMDDNQFGGAAIQHREVQGYESAQFLEYFQPAIRYMDGGHASGFNHVTVNPGAEKRLFQIKGKRNVRVKQVDPSISSLNQGDCFLLDVDRTIFVYVGMKAKGVERLKAITVANQLRDQDHNGRAQIEIIDAECHDGEHEKFFEALGSGDQDSVADAEDGGDDAEFERGTTQEVCLAEISDASGSIKITKLPKPLTKDQLNTKECYVLDTGSYSGICVWVGKESNGTEKAEAMKRAQQYLKAHNYPDWVHVSKVPEGVESTAFKQYFEDWN